MKMETRILKAMVLGVLLFWGVSIGLGVNADRHEEPIQFFGDYQETIIRKASEDPQSFVNMMVATLRLRVTDAETLMAIRGDILLHYSLVPEDWDSAEGALENLAIDPQDRERLVDFFRTLGHTPRDAAVLANSILEDQDEILGALPPE